MTAAVHQFVPSLAPRDAIGAHTLALQSLLRELGYESEVFADEVKPGMEDRARPYRSYASLARGGRRRGGGASWLLYQGSIGSPLADFLRAREEPKLVYFHNITPRELVEAWDPGVGQAAVAGRAQLVRLAPQVSAGFAASAYSARELSEVGVSPTRVVPLLVDLDAFDAEVDEGALARLRAGRSGPEWLFVGRLSPHKAQHVLVQALAAYRRAYDGGARLHLVGGAASQRYREAVAKYAEELDLAGAVDLAGSVTPGELAAHYRNADVLVCASGHEGFCVPLLEAMHHGLPIVAYGAAAVPETVGEAAVVLPTRSPAALAAAVDRVLRDTSLADAMAAAASARLAELSMPRARASMAAAVAEAVGQP